MRRKKRLCWTLLFCASGSGTVPKSSDPWSGCCIDFCGLFDGDSASARRFVALLLSPICSAAKAWILFFILIYLGLSTVGAALVTLLGIVSFSQMVFGSIPDSFAVSGLLLTMAFFLGIRSMRDGSVRLGPWLVLGILISGVTLSNIFIEVIVFGGAMLYITTAWRRVVRSAMLLVLSTLAASAIFGAISLRLFGLEEMSLRGGGDYVTRWLRKEESVNRALSLPVTFAHTIAAPMPKMVSNKHATRMRDRFRFRFTFSPPRFYMCREPVSILLMILLAVCALSLSRAGPSARNLSIVSAAVLCYNWLLHSIWGTDLLLYSQHWQPALMLFAAGPLLVGRSAVRRVVLVAYLLVVVAIAVANLHTVSSMLRVVEYAVPIESLP